MYLSNINLTVSKINQYILIANKGLLVGGNMTVILDLLVWAEDAYFSQCANISLEFLTIVDGTLTLDSNYFQTFNGAPILGTASGITIVNNVQLDDLVFPGLKVVGNIFMANNNNLSILDAFDNVQTINGNMNVSGHLPTSQSPVCRRYKVP